ncbi:hypothetical protein EI42_02403 [Thermosporothrix hazakensis]|jgi:hypothetical protein|uniref:Uncharacterized protein n=1 Tax=Thermosporothrix hazakensis TaxID=644383 RepID=A0A326U9L5_THEHA|nr:DUF6069 family protein [Thermosporothrix hazakensis]PZW31306.1 hypothetical protein EI42_02403 [Thermosporothrix hazakensis]GCE50783.1 hypothetical protein KTH_56520 [Thermosporothrix hazakensis]
MDSVRSRDVVALRKLLWVGPLVIVCAIIANLIIRTIATAFLGVPETFQYFQSTTIIGSTITYLLLALLAFVLVCRFARRPFHFYRILALIALLISLLTPVLALSGLMPIPGMSMRIFWVMIAMHVVSAAITVSLLTTLTHGSSKQRTN